MAGDIPDALSQLDFVDRQNGWAIENVKGNSEDWRVLSTTDSGMNWTAVKEESGINSASLKFFNAQNGYALMGDRLCYTSDAGDDGDAVGV